MIETNYADLIERLAVLKQSRAAKVLDGAKVDKDNDAIAALEAEISLADEVQAERVRRERQEALKADQAEVAKVNDDIAHNEVSAAKARKGCETKLREAAELQRIAYQHDAQVRKNIVRKNQLMGGRQSTVSEMESHRKDSFVWIAAIRSIINSPTWGYLRLPSATKSL